MTSTADKETKMCCHQMMLSNTTMTSNTSSQRPNSIQLSKVSSSRIHQHSKHSKVSGRSNTMETDPADGGRPAVVETTVTSNDNLEAHYIKNLQQQIYYLELENGYLRHQLHGNKDGETGVVTEKDKEKLMKLIAQSHHKDRGSSAGKDGEKSQNISKHLIFREELENQVKQKDEIIQNIERNKTELETRLSFAEESYELDKKLLKTEILDLRKQLDDSGPELMLRESQLSECQVELAEAQSRFRVIQQQLEALQEQLEMRAKEQKSFDLLEVEQKQEITAMTENMRELELLAGEQRNRAESQKEEMHNLQKQVREKELYLQKQKAICDKIEEESQAVIRENGELTATLAELRVRVEIETGDKEPREKLLTEMIRLREKDRESRHDIMRLQEEIHSEQMKFQQQNVQMREYENIQQSWTETQKDLQLKITNLDGFCRQMSNENKDLRNNLMQKDDRANELRKEIMLKNVEIENLNEKMKGMDRRYEELQEKYQAELEMSEDKFEQFEKLAKKVRELAKTTRPKSAINQQESSPD